MNRRERRNLKILNPNLNQEQLVSIAQQVNAQMMDFLEMDGDARLQTIYELSVGIQLMGKYVSANGLIDDCRTFHEKNNLKITQAFNKYFTPVYTEVKKEPIPMYKEPVAVQPVINTQRDGIIENKVFIDSCPERAGHYCRGDFVRGKECTANICPYKPGSPNYDHNRPINADKKERN